MTGEASPGYLPYPTIVREMERLLPQPPPKLIILGRKPLKRKCSSYKYNYVQPTVDSMKKGRLWAYEDPDLYKTDSSTDSTTSKNNGFPSRVRLKLHQNDSYYQPYLFTMEELIRAELNQLKECLRYYNVDENNQRVYVPGFGANAMYDLVQKNRNGYVTNLIDDGMKCNKNRRRDVDTLVRSI